MSAKERLDKVLLERGLFLTREKAKRGILAGLVSVKGGMVDKPGTRISAEADIEIKKDVCPYVSRGGLKLEAALREFGIGVEGKTAVDIGASTGGFTDCLLRKGAKKIYAVDVGYGQLDWKLRNDERVVTLERKNARYLRKEDIVGEESDLATIDVSFISLDKIIPVVVPLLNEKADIIALIKPQFEVGKGKVGKGGVVREANLHREVILKIVKLAEKSGLGVQGLISSPLRGPAGNREFFICLSKDKRGLEMKETKSLTDKVVNEVPVACLRRA